MTTPETLAGTILLPTLGEPTLADVLDRPAIWSGIGESDRRRIKTEAAMGRAFGAIEAQARTDATAMARAACPVAERIAAANTLPAPRNVIEAVVRPMLSSEAHKRDAALTILRIRANRAALGRPAPAMTARLLARAAASRHNAAVLMQGEARDR